MKKSILPLYLFVFLMCGNVYATDYALTPIEIQKILAGDAEAGDSFGNSVSISGDYAIVGAYHEDEFGISAGAAYIYYKDQGGPNNWGEVKKLTASDATSGDFFGISVSISGDYAIVGAVFVSTWGRRSGAAYIYYKDQGGPNNWGEVKKLITSNGSFNDQFGGSVSISGDYAIVGAVFEDSWGRDAGAAYIYYKDQGGGDNWGEVKKLTASNADSLDYFGISVSISGDYAIVGAYADDELGNIAGAAYIYYKDQGGTENWGEVKKLTASDAEADDSFGNSVSISGNYAIVGAGRKNTGGSDAGGACYIFNKDRGGSDNWGEVKKLIASDAETGDRFGVRVSISGDYIIVGALLEDTGGSDAGAAYIYYKDRGGIDNWSEVKKLTAADAEAGDHFGFGVSISGEYAIVGARYNNAGGRRAGAAYLFQLIDTSPCFAQNNCFDIYNPAAIPEPGSDYATGAIPGIKLWRNEFASPDIFSAANGEVPSNFRTDSLEAFCGDNYAGFSSGLRHLIGFETEALSNDLSNPVTKGSYHFHSRMATGTVRQRACDIRVYLKDTRNNSPDLDVGYFTVLYPNPSPEPWQLFNADVAVPPGASYDRLVFTGDSTTTIGLSYVFIDSVGICEIDVQDNSCIDFEADTSTANWCTQSVADMSIINVGPPYGNVIRFADASGQSYGINNVDFSGNWLERADIRCLSFDYKVDWNSGVSSRAGNVPRLGIYSGEATCRSTANAEGLSSKLRARFVDNFPPTYAEIRDDVWDRFSLPIGTCVNGELPSNSFGTWQVYDSSGQLFEQDACEAWNTLIRDVTGLWLGIDYNNQPSELVYFDNFCWECAIQEIDCNELISQDVGEGCVLTVNFEETNSPITKITGRLENGTLELLTSDCANNSSIASTGGWLSFDNPCMAFGVSAEVTPADPDSAIVIFWQVIHENGDTCGYTSEFECPATSVENETGLGDGFKELIRTYPNPSSNEITVQFTMQSSGRVEINLYDETGRFIKSVGGKFFEAGINNINIQTSGLPAGVYHVVLELQQQGGRVYKKIVVER